MGKLRKKVDKLIKKKGTSKGEGGTTKISKAEMDTIYKKCDGLVKNAGSSPSKQIINEIQAVDKRIFLLSDKKPKKISGSVDEAMQKVSEKIKNMKKKKSNLT